MEALERKLYALKNEKTALGNELKTLSSEIEERDAEVQVLKEKLNLLKSKHSDLASFAIEQVSFDLETLSKSLEELRVKLWSLQAQKDECEDTLSRLEAGIESYINDEVHIVFKKFLNYVEDNANILAYNIATLFNVSSIGKHTINGFIPSGKFGIFLMGSEQPLFECCDIDFGDPLYSYDRKNKVLCTMWYTTYEEKFYELFLDELKQNDSVYNDSFVIRVKDKNTFSLELV